MHVPTLANIVTLPCHEGLLGHLFCLEIGAIDFRTVLKEKSKAWRALHANAAGQLTVKTLLAVFFALRVVQHIPTPISKKN